MLRSRGWFGDDVGKELGKHRRRTASAVAGACWTLAVFVAASGCAAASHESALPDSPSAEIPIRRVVLYQNGVGYFEREGKVDGDVLSLSIRPSQINDLLKSLTVIDKGNGRAVSISLPLEKSGDRVLSELPEQVRSAGGLLEVLRVFRGARVEIMGQLGSVEGRVVGVEDLPRIQGDNSVSDWRATLRTDKGHLVVYPVRSIREIAIQDRTLAVGLDQSLDVSLNEGSWKPINLAIRLVGNDTHQLRASYIVEMPRWKPAYRLVLGEKSPLLQGWAVVDNVSGEDWNNVQLSLVAGTPLSFIYDLHSPQFTEREDLTPRTRTRAMAPPTNESGGVEEAEAEPDDAPMAKKELRRSAPPPMPQLSKSSASSGSGAALREEAALDFDETLESQAAPGAVAQQMGALFRYDLPDPVTVPDRSSTLVAIVNQRVDAEEVVFFRPEQSSEQDNTHPYRAVKLTNNTALTLETGPVTVYSGGTFTGEGFLGRVEPGSTHFVNFSVDHKVNLDSDYSTSQDDARLVRIQAGQLVSELLRTETTTYHLKNLHEKPVTAYIKTQKRSDWTLKNRPARTVDTPDALLVPLNVAAKGSGKLDVAWTRKVIRNVAIDTDLSTSVLKMYLQGGKVPPHVQSSLSEVLKIKGELAEADEEVKRLQKLHRALSQDQQRVRDNLNTLRKTKGNDALQRELAAKLASLEGELGGLSGKLVRLSEKRADLQGRMKVVFSGISLVVD